MIELEAEILRGSCTPVFFVGETIECEIRFKALNKKDNTTNNKFLNKKKNSLNTNEMSPSINESASNSNFNSESITFSIDDTSNGIDTNRMSEISESMFSMLSTLSTTSSKSTSMTSLAVTPTPSNGSHKQPPKSSSIFTFDRISLSSNTETELGEQSIAWACAQIDCHCFIDESKVNLPKDPLRYNLNSDKNELSNTSFQPNKDRIGISVFSSKPKILFCNLTLFPNQTKSCISILFSYSYESM